jgi:hypothetical protein
MIVTSNSNPKRGNAGLEHTVYGKMLSHTPRDPCYVFGNFFAEKN